MCRGLHIKDHLGRFLFWGYTGYPQRCLAVELAGSNHCTAVVAKTSTSQTAEADIAAVGTRGQMVRARLTGEINFISEDHNQPELSTRIYH